MSDKPTVPTDEACRTISRSNWDHQWEDTTGKDDLRDSNWRHIRCKHCATLRHHKGVATEHREWCTERIRIAIVEVRDRTAAAKDEETKRRQSDIGLVADYLIAQERISALESQLKTVREEALKEVRIQYGTDPLVRGTEFSTWLRRAAEEAGKQ